MELIDEYLAALEVGDAERVLALFAPDGIVHSPLYGAVPARQFYPTLFADTAELRVTRRRVFRADGEAVSFWFDFTWVLADGTSVSLRATPCGTLPEVLIELPPRLCHRPSPHRRCVHGRKGSPGCFCSAPDRGRTWGVAV